MGVSRHTEEEVTAGLMALIAWAGNASAASRYLKREKNIVISAPTLSDWKVRHGDRYDELREKYREPMEKRLENELRDAVAESIETTQLAVRKARVKLNAGEEKDPARAAANLAAVTKAGIDKIMTLSGRPTQITENRNVEEILRSLAGKGIIQLPDEPVPAQIGEATSEPAGD